MAYTFPLGIAQNEYFCNRVNEVANLLNNINNCTHTLLISPRRYGKTSLVYKALNESKLVNARIDFFMMTSHVDIEKSIIAGVDILISQISNNAEVLLNLIKDSIKMLKPSFEASAGGFKLKLETTQKNPPAANICEALQVLDRALRKKSLKAVLFFDEFQEIQRVAPGHGIEGAIRHAAQETKNFTIIFSGSRRNLLRAMFNDKNKPLYRLCDEIHLERISEKDYQHFIEKFSKQKWGNPLETEVIEKILECTQSHSYYFNALCDKLFVSKTLPNLQNVTEAWDSLKLLKKKDLLSELRDLNIAQKKILVAIAHDINTELTGHKFLAQAQVSGSTVFRALEQLEEMDIIEKKDDRYFIIDPLLKGVIESLTYL